MWVKQEKDKLYPPSHFPAYLLHYTSQFRSHMEQQGPTKGRSQGIWFTNSHSQDWVYEDVYDWVGAGVSQSPNRFRTSMELLLTCKNEQCCSSWKKMAARNVSHLLNSHRDRNMENKRHMALAHPCPFSSLYGRCGEEGYQHWLLSSLRLQNRATSQSSLQLWFGPNTDHNYIFYPLWTTFQATTKLFITALSVPWDLNNIVNVSLCEDSWRNDQKHPPWKPSCLSKPFSPSE